MCRHGLIGKSYLVRGIHKSVYFHSLNIKTKLLPALFPKKGKIRARAEFVNVSLFFLLLLSSSAANLLYNFYAPLQKASPLQPSSPLRGGTYLSFIPFPQILVESPAHSRSSMPVSCVNMSISRTRVVGTGPGVESGESSLVLPG